LKQLPQPVDLPAGFGASCQKNLIEDSIRRLVDLRGIPVQQFLAN
jgi:hypothetical protein